MIVRSKILIIFANTLIYLCLSHICPAARTAYNYAEDNFQLHKVNINEPYVDIGVHRVGKLGLTVINTGNIGTAWSSLPDPRDPSKMAPSAVYPYPGTNK